MIYSICTLSTLCVMILFLIFMIKFCDKGNKLLGHFLKKETHIFIKSKYRIFVLNQTRQQSSTIGYTGYSTRAIGWFLFLMKIP
jgi:hypothetical protein